MPSHQEKLTYFKFLLRNFGYLRREFLLLALTHNESTVEHTLASAVEPYSVPHISFTRSLGQLLSRLFLTTTQLIKSLLSPVTPYLCILDTLGASTSYMSRSLTRWDFTLYTPFLVIGGYYVFLSILLF